MVLVRNPKERYTTDLLWKRESHISCRIRMHVLEWPCIMMCTLMLFGRDSSINPRLGCVVFCNRSARWARKKMEMSTGRSYGLLAAFP
jgi:hypothetical protein